MMNGISEDRSTTPRCNACKRRHQTRDPAHEKAILALRDALAAIDDLNERHDCDLRNLAEEVRGTLIIFLDLFASSAQPTPALREVG